MVKRRGYRGTVTISGAPGIVIPHGATMPIVSVGPSIELTVVAWPWWRRALVFCGIRRAALAVPASGVLVVRVRSA